MGIIQEDTHWWFGSSADGTRSGLFPAAYVALLESPAEPEPESEAEEEAPPPPTAPAISAVPEPEPEPAAAGFTAVALYEYAGCYSLEFAI